MIQIKKFNYITGDTTSVSFGVSKIINFLDLDGRNVLLVCKEKRNSNSTGLTYLYNNKKEFTNFESFKEIFKNDGNLFRVDTLVLDLWHLSVSSILDYIDFIKSLNMDFIILAKEYHYKSSDDVSDYHITQESSVKLHSNEFIITDRISGWSSNLSDLKKSYIRDKKIEEIFDKKK